MKKEMISKMQGQGIKISKTKSRQAVFQAIFHKELPYQNGRAMTGRQIRT